MVRKVKGKDLMKSMNHCFEDSLLCKWCGMHWSRHRLDPQKCCKARPTPVTSPKEHHVQPPK